MTPQPAVVSEAECPWEGSTDPGLQRRRPVRWRLLAGAERTPSHSLTVGSCEITYPYDE
jgi:hypothetical protein